MSWFDWILTVMETLISDISIQKLVLVATIFLLTTLAAFMARRSGIFNLALDGTILVSACFAFLFSQLTTHWMGDKPGAISVLAGVLAGVFAGVVFTALVGWLIIYAGGNDIIVGLVANYAARHFSLVITGLAASIVSTAAISKLPVVRLAFLDGIPIIGPILGQSSILSWLTAFVPVGIYMLVNRTRLGLCLRAAEENPTALVNAGVQVSALKMKGLLISGLLASFAGIGCVLGSGMIYSSESAAPQSYGYLALVVVFAAGGRLGKSCGFALLLSILTALPAMLSTVEKMPLPLVRSLVYLAALILMLLHVFRHRHRFKMGMRKQVTQAEQKLKDEKRLKEEQKQAEKQKKLREKQEQAKAEKAEKAAKAEKAEKAAKPRSKTKKLTKTAPTPKAEGQPVADELEKKPVRKPRKPRVPKKPAQSEQASQDVSASEDATNE